MPAEVARALDASLDVFVVRRPGIPGRPGVAMGAVASGGTIIPASEVVDLLGITRRAIEAVARRELEDLRRRERAFRDGRPPADLARSTVVPVDDGIVAGSTMAAAARAARRRDARRVRRRSASPSRRPRAPSRPGAGGGVAAG